MSPIDFGREALSDLRASKLRSLLTALGVIIGVGSVTLLLSLGEGVRSQIGSTFADLGTTRLVVAPSGGSLGATASTITLDDVTAIAGVGGVQDVAASLTIPLKIQGSGALVTMPAIGTGTAYFAIAGDDFVVGAPFTGDGGAVLDESAVKSLFGTSSAADAIGREVKVGTKTVRVTGVVADPAVGGGSGNFGGGAAQSVGIVYLPIEPFMKQTNQQYVSQVSLRATEPGRVEQVRIAVRDLLAARHGLQDVQVISLARILDRVNEALSVITGFLAALAGISLLVGGIGIMNIMLAVVAERTRGDRDHPRPGRHAAGRDRPVPGGGGVDLAPGWDHRAGAGTPRRGRDRARDGRPGAAECQHHRPGAGRLHAGRRGLRGPAGLACRTPGPNSRAASRLSRAAG